MGFCPDFCGHVGKRLDEKAQANFKIYDVTDWINNYNKHIEQCNVSRCKANQIMKIGQFIEYNMKNIFLRKSYTCGGKASPKLFYKKAKLSTSLGLQSKILYCLLLFSKNKKRSGSCSLASFSAWFLKKSISGVIFY